MAKELFVYIILHWTVSYKLMKSDLGRGFLICFRNTFLLHALVKLAKPNPLCIWTRCERLSANRGSCACFFQSSSTISNFRSYIWELILTSVKILVEVCKEIDLHTSHFLLTFPLDSNTLELFLKNEKKNTPTIK